MRQPLERSSESCPAVSTPSAMVSRSRLRAKGCRVGQGFYFSAPVRAEALYPLLKQNNMNLQARAR